MDIFSAVIGVIEKLFALCPILFLRSQNWLVIENCARPLHHHSSGKSRDDVSRMVSWNHFCCFVVARTGFSLDSFVICMASKINGSLIYGRRRRIFFPNYYNIYVYCCNSSWCFSIGKFLNPRVSSYLIYPSDNTCSLLKCRSLHVPSKSI